MEIREYHPAELDGVENNSMLFKALVSSDFFCSFTVVCRKRFRTSSRINGILERSFDLFVLVQWVVLWISELHMVKT